MTVTHLPCCGELSCLPACVAAVGEPEGGEHGPVLVYLWDLGVQRGNPKLPPKLGCGAPRALGWQGAGGVLPAWSPWRLEIWAVLYPLLMLLLGIAWRPHFTSPVGAGGGQQCSDACRVAVPLQVRDSPEGLVMGMGRLRS